ARRRVGSKRGDASRERLKAAGQKLERTPHWLIKQAIFNYLDQIERGLTPPEIAAASAAAGIEDDGAPAGAGANEPYQPFIDFAESTQPQSVLRAAITAAYRRPEPELLPMLAEQARLAPDVADAAHK